MMDEGSSRVSLPTMSQKKCKVQKLLIRCTCYNTHCDGVMRDTVIVAVKRDVTQRDAMQRDAFNI